MRIFALSWVRAVAVVVRSTHDHIFLLGVSTGVGRTRILVAVRSTHDHIFFLGMGVSIGIGTRILVTVTRRHGSLSMG
jgi:hypothetical protein